jgi:hypothetical protein
MFNRISASRPNPIGSFFGTAATPQGVASTRTTAALYGFLPEETRRTLRATGREGKYGVNTMRRMEQQPKYRRGYKITVGREHIPSFMHNSEYHRPLYIMDILDNGRGYVTLIDKQIYGTEIIQFQYGPTVTDHMIATAEDVLDQYEWNGTTLVRTQESEFWHRKFDEFMQEERVYDEQVRKMYPEGISISVTMSHKLYRMLNARAQISSITNDFHSEKPIIPWADIEYEPGARVARIRTPLDVTVNIVKNAMQMEVTPTVHFPAYSQVVFVKYALFPGMNKRMSLTLDDATNLGALISATQDPVPEPGPEVPSMASILAGGGAAAPPGSVAPLDLTRGTFGGRKSRRNRKKAKKTRVRKVNKK